MGLHQHQAEKLNLSGALALFCPTFEDLEVLKCDLVDNMQSAIDRINREHPIGLTQDEFDQWYLNEFGVSRERVSEEAYAILSEVRNEVHKIMIEHVTTEPRRTIKRIVGRQQHLQQPLKKLGGVTDAQIEEAREYPLEDLIEKRIFKATGRWRGNCHCPLIGHEGEKTPSFYIDKSNRYKCFGCHGKGDAIDYVMQRDGIGFVQAVKTIIRM